MGNELYSSVAAGLERARGRIFQAGRRTRRAVWVAEQAAAAEDPEVRRRLTAEALRTAIAASDSCGMAGDLIAGAVAVLTAEELRRNEREAGSGDEIR